jgi:hypothetical protein
MKFLFFSSCLLLLLSLGGGSEAWSIDDELMLDPFDIFDSLLDQLLFPSEPQVVIVNGKSFLYEPFDDEEEEAKERNIIVKEDNDDSLYGFAKERCLNYVC